MRLLAAPAVVVAIAVGVVISLVLTDGDGESRAQVATPDQAERLVRRNLRLYAPTARDPSSVACRNTAGAYFSCTVLFTGEAPDEAVAFGYDLNIPIHDPPTALERAFLKRLLSERP